MAVASVEDIQVSLLRDLTPAETKYAPQLLDRVENMIVARVSDAVARSGADESFRATLVAVEAEAVARVLRSPNSGIYQSETEGNYSYRINWQVASGLLDVLDREWERLGVGGGLQVLAPATDAYLETRGRGLFPPPYRFQYAWPGEGEMSESWPGGVP
ncbi:Gp19/Gp15/Gp42 family protein [Gleimia europaea]|uniref:Gp19/Gp15/Gp42 family protein n=1 Tax=Gleimia europaea TaxID=66228 RepID=UPI0026598B2F|nr:Gp19/Gp15/Gp42 family protein [Gleimia europaea]MDK7143386.1 Gp19/Gp15/Gp42 family protein [Gleimia europaea]